MEVTCSFKKIVASICGTDQTYNHETVVPLSSCDKDIWNHTRSFGISDEYSEIELILARFNNTILMTGMWDVPVPLEIATELFGEDSLDSRHIPVLHNFFEITLCPNKVCPAIRPSSCISVLTSRRHFFLDHFPSTSFFAGYWMAQGSKPVPPGIPIHALKGKQRKAHQGIGKFEWKIILQQMGVFLPVGLVSPLFT